MAKKKKMTVFPKDVQTTIVAVLILVVAVVAYFFFFSAQAIRFVNG